MKQNSLVLELQEHASSSETGITDLLNKALMTSRKLKLDDFTNWVRSEIDGYENGSLAIPKYREIYAHMQAYHPLSITDADIHKLLHVVPMKQTAAALDSLLHAKDSQFKLSISEPAQQAVREYLQVAREYSIYHIITKDQIASILGIIRTSILEWALRLEEEGILGYGLTFTSQEKITAMTNIHIGNFQGNLGDITNSNVTQNLKQNIKSGDFESFANYLKEHKVDPQDIKDLEQAVADDPTPTEPEKYGASVSQWIQNMIGKSASGAWDVTIGAAGSLLAEGLKLYYGLFS